MHSFLVALAYLAMMFAPCAVAHWGESIVLPWNFRFAKARWRRRAARLMDPLVEVLARQEEAEALRFEFSDAFVAPAALPPFRAPQTTFADVLEMAQQSSGFEAARSRVAATLAKLADAHRLANTVVMESADEPVLQAMLDIADRGDAETFATPAAAELDAMFATEGVDSSPGGQPVRRLLLPQSLLPTELVPRDAVVAETPPALIEPVPLAA